MICLNCTRLSQQFTFPTCPIMCIFLPPQLTVSTIPSHFSSATHYFLYISYTSIFICLRPGLFCHALTTCVMLECDAMCLSVWRCLVSGEWRLTHFMTKSMSMGKECWSIGLAVTVSSVLFFSSPSFSVCILFCLFACRKYIVGMSW